MAMLRIEGLTVSGIIGVDDWERRVPQALRLDVELEVDIAAAAASDAIVDALDYGRLATELTDAVAARSCRLIERLASELLDLIEARYAPQRCTLTLHKPGAVPSAASVSITVTR